MRIPSAIVGVAIAAACLLAAHADAMEATAGKTVTVDEAQGPSMNRITPKRHPSTATTKQDPGMVTPKRVRTTSAAATTAPHSSQPRSLSNAPISCAEACRAECAGPKKGKSACGPAYQSCVAAC